MHTIRTTTKNKISSSRQHPILPSSKLLATKALPRASPFEQDFQVSAERHSQNQRKETTEMKNQKLTKTWNVFGKKSVTDEDCGCFEAIKFICQVKFAWNSTSQLYGEPLKLYRTFWVGNHTTRTHAKWRILGNKTNKQLWENEIQTALYISNKYCFGKEKLWSKIQRKN